jgi:8-amino-7-oxononanoate synthase
MPTSIDVFAKAREHERLEQLRTARELGVFPYFRVLEGPTLPVVEMEGQRRIMLGSNNYLGLTGDERVKQGALDALHRYGTGLTGSRFLNGTIDMHLELEREFAEWLETEAALVFTTGHQANVGTLGTILGPGDTVVVDSGDHASILDGCILSRAKLRAFKHNRIDRLEHTLERAAEDGGGVLVVVDGVYSMEGDVAPLPEIADLCSRFGARLMVDEAHALGVLGARGTGASELLGVEDRVDLRSDRGTGGRDRVPADPVPPVHLHRLRRPRRHWRGARRCPDLPLGRGAVPVREGPGQRALPAPRPA